MKKNKWGLYFIEVGQKETNNIIKRICPLLKDLLVFLMLMNYLTNIYQENNYVIQNSIL